MRSMHLEPDIPLENGVFVIEFYARWCGTCRSITRIVTELEEEMGFKGVLVDVEQLPLVARSFRVKGVPIIVVTEDGVELLRIGGSMTKEEVRNWLLESKVI